MADFIVRKSFRQGGVWRNPGETIDLTGFDSRTIAKLMEQDLVDVSTPAAPAPEPPKVVVAHFSCGQHTAPYLEMKGWTPNSTILNLGGVITVSGDNYTVSEAGVYRVEVTPGIVSSTSAAALSVNHGVAVNGTLRDFNYSREVPPNFRGPYSNITRVIECVAGDVVRPLYRLVTDPAGGTLVYEGGTLLTITRLG